jgi:hypothetical protein
MNWSIEKFYLLLIEKEIIKEKIVKEKWTNQFSQLAVL